jgi:hypothetical protein
VVEFRAQERVETLETVLDSVELLEAKAQFGLETVEPPIYAFECCPHFIEAGAEALCSAESVSRRLTLLASSLKSARRASSVSRLSVIGRRRPPHARGQCRRGVKAPEWDLV